jgi:hypothetical protein
MRPVLVAPPLLVAEYAPYWGGWHGPGVYGGFIGIGRLHRGHHGGMARSVGGRRGGRR